VETGVVAMEEHFCMANAVLDKGGHTHHAAKILKVPDFKPNTAPSR
jgi:hypothetical protein